MPKTPYVANPGDPIPYPDRWWRRTLKLRRPAGVPCSVEAVCAKYGFEKHNEYYVYDGKAYEFDSWYGAKEPWFGLQLAYQPDARYITFDDMVSAMNATMDVTA